jgi:DNA topoisomerase-1
MPKTLVIVESPAKAKTISKYLGSEYVVKSSVGHIRDLPKGKSKSPSKRNLIPKDLPEDEKRRLKKINNRKRLVRRMGIDPDNGWAANYEIIPDKAKVIKELKAAAKSVESIFLATDLDREGEAIAWHLKEALGAEKFNYSRVRFNQITKDAILESFLDPKEIDLNLVKAQQARRFLDRVVGFELSPLLWTKIARNLSAGRVQSVALRLLVEREHSIQKFKPEEFWEISFSANNIENKAISFALNRKKNDSLLKLKEARKIEKLIQSSSLSIHEVTQKPVTVKPKPPFMTSTLQQAASTKLGFNVRRTMRTAQTLYENGLITYMRTDAPALSAESIADARMFIETNLGEKYLTNAPRIYSSSKNAQEAHEAIRPTNAATKSESMISTSADEKKLYDLIWQQFIGSQLPDAEYLATNAKIKLEDYIFSATGREVVFDGFTRIVKFRSDDKDSEILPRLKQNEVLSLDNLNNKQKYTKPPARFSEAALVKELEKRGIGRPSTYANIISTIQERGYVEIQNRRFFVKKIGMIVSDRLVRSFDDIMDYDFTANFENKLDKIANGEMDWQEVLDSYYQAFQDDLVNAMDEENGMLPNLPTHTNINCPECKKHNLMIRNSSNGVFLGCAGYSLSEDERCKKTLNLISGDEAVSVDDQEEAEHLVTKHRCSKCDMSMDNYLLDENHKLHVCSNNPDCDGSEVEEGNFKIKGYDGPTLSCHKCGSEMQLKTGRFGKYFGCINDNCGTTRALQRNGEPKPIMMEPITTDIPCKKFEDFYLLRDSMKGLFLAASKYPKNRETRAPSVSEFIQVANEVLLVACEYLDDPMKHVYLLEAPMQDVDGNPYIIRYNKAEDIHYLASEKDAKKTGNTAIYNGEKWVEATK